MSIPSSLSVCQSLLPNLSSFPAMMAAEMGHTLASKGPHVEGGNKHKGTMGIHSPLMGESHTFKWKEQQK